MIKRIAAAAILLAAMPLGAQAIFNPVEAARNGWTSEQNRTPGWYLAQHRKLETAMAALQPQKTGAIDAFVLSISLDSDAVFAREASEASRVLSRRYNAAGRTLLLTAGATDKSTGNPQGSPDTLAIALSAIAGKMQLDEDVLILFATTHGDAQMGLAYRDGSSGSGMIAPVRLASMLDQLGFKRRMILISACYSGVFVPLLTNDQTIIVTAASSRRTSFGCAPGNDWTFFGDALINNALRKPQSFEQATTEATKLIGQWENAQGLLSSDPQVFLGEGTRGWLSTLEAHMPKSGTAPVGQPAVASTAKLLNEGR